MSLNSFRAVLAAAALIVAGAASADEPKLLLEEVTVIGAVHSSDAVTVADIDMAGDDSLADMPVAYE